MIRYNVIKSVSYAFIAHGIHVYNEESDKFFLANRLVCTNCNKPWYMNLSECFLCGTINHFIFKCSNCNNFVSITNSNQTCNSCGQEGTLHQVCANQDCPSNTQEILANEINKYGGVFNEESGFKIAQQNCLYCGNNNHIYKNKIIYVVELIEELVVKEKLNLDEIKDDKTIIIFRINGADDYRYSFLTKKEIENKPGDKFVLTNIINHFSELSDQIFSI